MTMLHYICKYTPVELLRAMGAECAPLNGMLPGFDAAERLAGPNICGFGKTVIEQVAAGDVHELVLVDCCDAIRSVRDVLEAQGGLDFLFMMDMLHCDTACAREELVREMHRLMTDYGDHCGARFDAERFRKSFQPRPEALEGRPGGDEGYVAVIGARMGDELAALVRESIPCGVRNLTCIGNTDVHLHEPPDTNDVDELLEWYAGVLFGQMPCIRMADISGRRALFEDPALLGIIYHTVKFCDFYSFEYAQVREAAGVPLIKIESDYTMQSTGQLATRLEAFAETLRLGALSLRRHTGRKSYPKSSAPSIGTESAGDPQYGNPMECEGNSMRKRYFAGIDSGSSSTDVAIIDGEGTLVASAVIPTGAGASVGAARALEAALEGSGIAADDIAATVSTGYGRAAVEASDRSITEISCHARGAHFIDPSVRTVIDIGGQDSKVIALNATGGVANFAMNDKCAAGTGRFLETMARTLQMPIDELARRGLTHREDIVISNTCTVFAESEVVSLIAQNKDVDDIVHGLDCAVASRTTALVKRVGGTGPYMMTGGVAQNAGVVKALEEGLGERMRVDGRAQLCGAIGAALYARDL